MDLSGRPLLDTPQDRGLFAARNLELRRLKENVGSRHNVLVIGERGSGKTSLLRQLTLALRESRPDKALAPAFVEGRLADSPAMFLDLVRLRLGLEPKVRRESVLEATMAGMTTRGRPRLDDALELPRLVASLEEAVPRGNWRAVLVDEIPNADIARTIFGQLRDELWQLPIVWVVAVADSNVGSFAKPPADAFFDMVLRLEPLDVEQQGKLLKARAGQPGARLAKEVDEGNVRRLLALARAVLSQRRGGAQTLRALSARQAKVATLGRPASMLVSEMEVLGPVSASDERLLNRLGWTRERAVQVLRSLEAAGLVESDNVKGESGRPRKVYRLSDLASQ
jgi:hypothetical protein